MQIDGFKIGYSIGLSLGLGLVLMIVDSRLFGLLVLGISSTVFIQALRREGLGTSFGEHYELYEAIAKRPGMSVLQWTFLGVLLFLSSYGLLALLLLYV